MATEIVGANLEKLGSDLPANKTLRTYNWNIIANIATGINTNSHKSK